ncbi:Thioredoxin reductase [Chloracidobacterium thermophilum B]|uniref:Thioredoxin reductase n=2 Tax=Chloracidobacterium thermophilum TaxID=458033 RepID=G2LDK7_CHLTF|nr:Thioredoxin reductase [Chloracidobacterium thermophilum B]
MLGWKNIQEDENLMSTYDLIIIGAGPAGLTAAYAARQFQLDYLVLERAAIAQTIAEYPIGRTLFSTPDEIELIPGTLQPRFGPKPTREEVLAYYTRLATRELCLPIHTYEPVQAILPTGTGFQVISTKAVYEARQVIIATGGFGHPYRLGVPGETPARVSYRFVEAFPYAGKRILVVGGGNSAAEAALDLCRAGVQVDWSLRRPTLDPHPDDPDQVGIKPWVRAPLMECVAQGELTIHYATTCIEVLPNAARLQHADGTVDEVPCDHIFALLGAKPEVSLLAAAGVTIAADGRPVYDPETNETNVPGLYVVGHLTRELHMKNATVVPRRVVEGIAQKLTRAGSATG